MSAWSCPQPGEILCADDAVRMPVGSVLERLADVSGKRYRVLSTPAELTRLRTAHADLLARCDAADHARGHDPVSARTPAGRISTDTVRAVLGGGGDE